MVTVTNRKTGQSHEFDNASWEVAKEKGLDKKYRVVSQNEELKSDPVNFTPPELNNGKKEVVVEKKVVRKKKDIIAG